MLKLYNKYYSVNKHSMVVLFRELKKKFKHKKVLYPGSYVHITPSLIFQEVTYVDSFKKTGRFFNDPKVKEFIEKNKEYKRKANFKFYQQDYFKNFPEKLKSFDIVISQSAGFVGQAVKKYLKKGGILVCNDSHGDASMASTDSDYELVGVYNNKFKISVKDLDKYLIPKKGKISKKHLKKSMKGIKFIESSEGYIFRKRL